MLNYQLSKVSWLSFQFTILLRASQQPTDIWPRPTNTKWQKKKKSCLEPTFLLIQATSQTTEIRWPNFNIKGTLGIWTRSKNKNHGLYCPIKLISWGLLNSFLAFWIFSRITETGDYIWKDSSSFPNKRPSSRLPSNPWNLRCLRILLCESLTNISKDGESHMALINETRYVNFRLFFTTKHYWVNLVLMK